MSYLIIAQKDLPDLLKCVNRLVQIRQEDDQSGFGAEIASSNHFMIKVVQRNVMPIAGVGSERAGLAYKVACPARAVRFITPSAACLRSIARCVATFATNFGTESGWGTMPDIDVAKLLDVVEAKPKYDFRVDGFVDSLGVNSRDDAGNVVCNDGDGSCMDVGEDLGERFHGDMMPPVVPDALGSDGGPSPGSL